MSTEVSQIFTRFSGCIGEWLKMLKTCVFRLCSGLCRNLQLIA
jgi:hypothetical protein